MKVNEAAGLKAELAKGKRGRGRRYDPELKKRALVYIRQRRREGAGYKRIGRELGLGFETVRRWSLASAQGSGAKTARRFAPVQIVPEPKPSRTPVSIVSPAGYRLEGLGLEEAIVALRALR